MQDEPVRTMLKLCEFYARQIHLIAVIFGAVAALFFALTGDTGTISFDLSVLFYGGLAGYTARDDHRHGGLAVQASEKEGGYGMSLFNKTVAAFRKRDFAALRALHHEDYVYLGQTVTSREDHMDMLAEMITDTDWHERVACVFEDEFTLVMRVITTDADGNAKVSNNLSIKQDGLYLRTISTVS